MSQNKKQQVGNNYSYTLYDGLGRITEVGQKNAATAMNEFISRDPIQLSAWMKQTYSLNGQNVIAEQVTSTVYDVNDPEVASIPSGYIVGSSFQKGYTLRNRVSYSRTYDVLPVTNGGQPMYSQFNTSATYSYDIHGNVDTLLNNYRSGIMAANGGLNRYKLMAYNYDLISGKVNEVHYQPGMADGFYHRYEYDAENRLTDVYTTTRKGLLGIPGLEDHEAFYQYYKHGPLARTVLGQQQVQGLDYAYTLQGWLKGVNSTSLNTSTDMGNDGQLTSPNSQVAKDAFGYSLNYYSGDYTAVNSTVNPFPGFSAYLNGNYRPLYNGNISSMAVNIGKFNQPLLYNYLYDQLNRLKGMDTYNGLDQTNNNWNGLTSIPDYMERVNYDANGNIKNYLRKGAGGAAMDSLGYHYNYDANGLLATNKLQHVTDQAGNIGVGDLGTQNPNNYGYDSIGNLISDVSENINSIQWSVYGKILKISKLTGDIIFNYDPHGNRISKNVAGVTTWYVRDATGNVMSTYTLNSSINSGHLTQSELDLYGSARLGVYIKSNDIQDLTSANFGTFERGKKFFELSNHLGNVHTTISDKKTLHYSDGTNIDYNTSDVVTANDYYPFGMQMPGRSFFPNNSPHRYSFNGKEDDKDINGGAQDYGARIYDKRVVRFLSVDPLSKEYPALTPFQFASNSPIAGKDRDGLEFEPYWASTVPQHIREYENDLHKRDPKNAEAIIRQHNINAFLFVGGALTAGSGGASGIFWDLTMVGGTARATQGIITHNQLQTNEGLHVMTGAAMGEIGGFVLNKIFQVASPLLSEVSIFTNIRAKLVNSNEVNSTFNQKGWYSPYKSNSTLAEINLPTDVSGIVRLSGPKNILGEWFTTLKEIKGLTAAQLKDKFALKYQPTLLTSVSIKGNVRVGEAAKVDGVGEGGGFQIEVLKGGSVNYGKTVHLNK